MQTNPPGVIQGAGPLDHTRLKQRLNQTGILTAQSAKPVVEIRLDTGAPDQQGRTIDADAANHPPIHHRPIISHESDLCDNRS
jgi:hypothetical protein